MAGHLNATKNFIISVDDSKRRSLDVFSLFEDARKSSLLTDVVICAGSKEISCHKIILAMNSGYFRAMFTCDMLENKLQKLYLKGLEPSVVEALVGYIYSGKIYIAKENIFDLLEAAEMLKLQSIIDRCSTEISKRILTPDNCIQIYFYSCSKGPMKELSKKSLRKICDNFSNVVETSGFLTMTKEDLITVLSSKDMTVSEDAMFSAIVRWKNYCPEERDTKIPDIVRSLKLPMINRRHIASVASVAFEKVVNCRRILTGAVAHRRPVEEPQARKPHRKVSTTRKPVQTSNEVLLVAKIFRGPMQTEELTNDSEAILFNSDGSRENRWVKLAPKEANTLYDWQSVSSIGTQAIIVAKDNIFFLDPVTGKHKDIPFPGTARKSSNPADTDSRLIYRVSSVGHLVFLIGVTSKNEARMWQLDKVHNKWSVCPRPPAKIRHDEIVITTSTNDKLFLISVEENLCYTPSIRRWTRCVPLPKKKETWHIYGAVCSGRTLFLTASDGVHVYDVRSHSWSQVSSSREFGNLDSWRHVCLPIFMNNSLHVVVANRHWFDCVRVYMATETNEGDKNMEWTEIARKTLSYKHMLYDLFCVPIRNDGLQ
ncbi:kelch-like protein 5 [Anneissia japonica]|uniref:kelch-like protein 5 n=1 Tax=Anneissia japonica TaxID=1529436 RepID=UPI001425AB72|nr:kelch-like protein 5 [Anneissia japonica]